MKLITGLIIGFLSIAILVGVSSTVCLFYVLAAVDEVNGVVEERGAQLVALAHSSHALMELCEPVFTLDATRERFPDGFADPSGLSNNAAESAAHASHLIEWLDRYRTAADEQIERDNGQQMLRLAEELVDGLKESGSPQRRVLTAQSRESYEQLSGMITYAIDDESDELIAAKEAAASYRASAINWGVFVSGVAVLIASGLGLVVAWSINQSVSPLCVAAGRLERGEWGTRVVGRGAAEFRVLASAFNDMAAAVQATNLSLEKKIGELASTNDRLRHEQRERQRTSAALRRSEEQFRAVAETAQDAILCTDAEGRMIFANAAAESMFGYGPAELVHQPIGQIINHTLDELIQMSIDAPIVSGKKAVFEATGTVRAGDIVSLVLSLSDWRTDRGHFYTIIARRLDDHPSINPSAGMSNHRPTI